MNQRHILLTSFSPYKGEFVHADITLDMRDAPDPWDTPGLSHRDGTHRGVQQYVFQFRSEKRFLEEIMEEILACNGQNGLRRIETVSALCVGGHHRSVSMIERLAKRLQVHGIAVTVVHRELERDAARAKLKLEQRIATGKGRLNGKKKSHAARHAAWLAKQQRDQDGWEFANGQRLI